MPMRKDPVLKSPIFTRALFRFLRELKANNNREWFQANKDRFETDVKAPVLAFILAFADPLEGISRNHVADPRGNGGSMFRIYRDTRFSMNKEPYKLNAGAQFRHRGHTRDVHSPGFYLHLQPGGCFVSTGLWRPDSASLHRIREWMVSHPRAWKAIGAAGIEVAGESLKRVPAGFDPGHALAEDLKLKDFYTYTPLLDREVCSPDFLERFTAICRENAPLVAFLTKALELPW